LSKEPKPFETWIIKHKDTGQIWQAPSGKTSWKAKGHAKNAWASMSKYDADKWDIDLKEECERFDGHNYWSGAPYFDYQDKYILIKLEPESTILTRLQKAESILKDILNNYEAGEKIDSQIKEFLGDK